MWELPCGHFWLGVWSRQAAETRRGRLPVMRIVLSGAVEGQRLGPFLARRGWRPVVLAGRPAYKKEEGVWVWLAWLEPQPEFISWVPDDGQACRQAEGFRRLVAEVDAICAELGIPQAVTAPLRRAS